MEGHYVRVYRRNMYLHYFYCPTVYAVKLRNSREETKRDAVIVITDVLRAWWQEPKFAREMHIHSYVIIIEYT